MIADAWETRDARHIAAASPDVVLALIAEVRVWRAGAADLDAALARAPAARDDLCDAHNLRDGAIARPQRERDAALAAAWEQGREVAAAEVDCGCPQRPHVIAARSDRARMMLCAHTNCAAWEAANIRALRNPYTGDEA